MDTKTSSSIVQLHSLHIGCFNTLLVNMQPHVSIGAIRTLPLLTIVVDITLLLDTRSRTVVVVKTFTDTVPTPMDSPTNYARI